VTTRPRVGFMAITWPGLYTASGETGEAWIQTEDTLQAIAGLESTCALDLVPTQAGLLARLMRH